MSLIVTPGDPKADAYVSVTDAADWLQQCHNDMDVWNMHNRRHKEVFIRIATCLMDTQMAWKGSPTWPKRQRLQHPRSGLVDRFGNAYPKELYIPPLVHATSELAFYLAKYQPDVADVQFDRISVGNSFSIDLKTAGGVRFGVPPYIYEMIRWWAVPDSGRGMTRLVRC